MPASAQILIGTLAVSLLCCFVNEAHAQSQRVFRCKVDGKVTFQQGACRSNEETNVLDVKPGNTIPGARQPQPATAASAAAESPPARQPQKSALDREAEECLAHLRPFLRDPRSAYASGPSREGRVLSLTVHANNARGGVGTRKAACEFFNGSVDASWTKIHLKRLGWFQPKPLVVDKRPRRGHDADDIEAPPSS